MSDLGLDHLLFFENDFLFFGLNLLLNCFLGFGLAAAPVAVGLFILYFFDSFMFAKNAILLVFGLLVMLSGLVLGYVSMKHLGKNRDDS